MRSDIQRSIARLAAVIMLLVLGLSSSSADQPKLDVSLGTPVMLENQRATAYLRVALTGQELKDEKARAPLNVSIVLDRSGSMQGEKIEAAKRAAKLAIERLRPNDVVSIITYETTVNIALPATRIGTEMGDTSATREKILAAIDEIQPGGSTALFAGVSMGAGELRKQTNTGRVNRLVLLSDGLANVGPSSPGELGELGSSLAKEGIAVTTLGLGLDYNEDLMTRLAQSSDGNHMFIENVNDLERAYAMEFGDAMTVVAHDVDVRIHCNEGVRPVRALGREMLIDGQNVHAKLNQLASGRTKYCLLEVEIPAGAAGNSASVAQVEISYVGANDNIANKLNGDATVRYANSREEVEKNTNKAVMVAAIQQIAADQNILAMRLRDTGKIEEAKQALMSNGAFLNENGFRFKDEQLLRDANTNNDAAKNLDSENWKRSRKGLQQYQVGIKQQSIVLEK